MLSGSQKQHLYPGRHCRFQRQTAGPSDKVDVCLLPAGPFSGAALVGQGAQANSLRSSFFSVLEFKLWKINILQYTLALQLLCPHLVNFPTTGNLFSNILTSTLYEYTNTFFVRQ